MSDGPTPAEVEAASAAGNALATLIWPLVEGQKAGVVMNCVGNLVVLIFTGIPFDEPQHALQEFDNWTVYTRAILAEEIKERLS